MKTSAIKRFLLVPAAGFIVLMLMSMSFANDASSSEGGVQWISFEQALQKSKTEKRPIFIDVYTDWCGWCKVMEDPLVSP